MSPQLAKIGLTPAKGVLVLVLGAALVAVWGPQIVGALGGSSRSQPAKPTASVAASPAASVPRLTSGSPPRVAPRAPAAEASEPVDEERPLPVIAVADAIAHDPFARPPWAPRSADTVASEATPDEYEQRFAQLATAGVAMVLVSNEGRAAQVGDRTLRPGDEIEGFRVVEITATGITLTPATPNDTGAPRGG